MGFYRDRVGPIIVDFACSSRGMRKWRRRCVVGLSGRVVEIGFGAGRNLPFYPDEVTEVVAIEPSKMMRDRAEERVGAAPFPVVWGGLDGQQLDLLDDAFDAAVVTSPSARFPTPRERCASCAGWCVPVASCECSSTGWPLTNGFDVGSVDSMPSSGASRTAANS